VRKSVSLLDVDFTNPFLPANNLHLIRNLSANPTLDGTASIKTDGEDASEAVIWTFSIPTNREKNGRRVSVSFTRYNSSVSVTLVKCRM
jgi:hypothetical protein